MTTKTIRTMLLTAIAVGCSLVTLAGHFYVDANNGNDTWNGLSETENGTDPSTGLVNGPRKTLMGILAVANNSWAIIHAAPGHYNEGEYKGSGGYTNYYARVAITAGQTLIATKGPEVTFIDGASDTSETKMDSNGNGAKALRCLSLWGNSKVIGFTITGGRLRSKNDDGSDTMSSRGAGILFVGQGYVVNCVITNNISPNRGGGAYGGECDSSKAILINCRLLNNSASSPCAATMYCTLIGCVSKGNTGSSHCGYGKMYNCTIFDGIYNSKVYDCYVASGADKGSCTFTNCYYVTGSTKGNNSTYNECFDYVAAEYDFADDGMPKKTNPLVNALTDTTTFDAAWPTDSKIAAYKALDAMGYQRVCGSAMDVGAVEYNWVRQPPAGLTVSLKDNGNGTTNVVFSRDFPSKDTVVKTVTLDGTTYSFEGKADDFTYEQTVTGDARDLDLSVTYFVDQWYVDDDGSDDNDGYHKGSPFKTFKKAMSKVSSGGTVHVAPGLYNYGDMGFDGNATNRVHVSDGVTLVGDQGAANTIIEGKYADGAQYGCGPDAIRCVRLGYGAVLKGFTLRNGATCIASEYAGNGGGVLGSNTDTTYGKKCSIAADCIIEDCRAVRGGAATSGKYVRCLFRRNESSNRTYANLGTYDSEGYYGCVFEDGANHGFYNPRACTIVNCTFRNGTTVHAKAIKVYNSYIAVDYSTESSVFYRSVIGQADSSAVKNYQDGTCYGTAANSSTDDTTYRPLFDASKLRDTGNNEYLALYPEGFLDNVDITGGKRQVSTAVDIGAGEYSFDGETDCGFTYVMVDAGNGTTNLTITPVHDSPLPISGFTFNGKEYVFDGVAPITTDNPFAGDPITALTPHYATVTNWYVSPTGNDDNVGYASDVPFKTFTKAMSKASSGHIVHALAGTYDYEEMGVYLGTTNRVVVKADVGLVADEGPDKTIIVGKFSETTYGIGADSIRCVYLNNGAYIRGFAITGGSANQLPAPNAEYGYCGGGVASASVGGAAVVDCVITNNRAIRGGGEYQSTCIRCFFKDNKAVNHISAGTDGYDGIYIDCVSANGGINTPYLVLNCSLYNDSKVINSGYLANHNSSPTPASQTYNTLMYDVWKAARYCTNCVFVTTPSSTKQAYMGDCTYGQGGNMTCDANYRPVYKNNSPLIDQGRYDIYTNKFPTAWKQFMSGEDFACGQRVYNAKIDVGAGEYDWRGKFADNLNGRKTLVEVKAASAGVEAETKALSMADGDEVTIDWTAVDEGEQSFRFAIDGEGALSVTLDGDPLQATSLDKYTFNSAVGVTRRLVIRFTGAGTGTISKCRGPMTGLYIMFK